MIDPSELYTEKQAAFFLGVTAPTLRTYRSKEDYGPPYVRVDTMSIRYRGEDLITFLAARKPRKTKDAA